MNLKIKLCIALILAGCFVPHFARATQMNIPQIVLETLETEDIRSYLDFDDYDDYLNGLKWDVVRIICSREPELPLCKAWNRLKTAKAHSHAVLGSLEHLEHILQESYKWEDGYSHIKDSCGREEVASYMIPACEVFSEYEQILKEIKEIASPIRGQKLRLEQLESQWDEKRDEREQLNFQLDEKEGEREQLKSQLNEKKDEKKQLESLLAEEERGLFSWIYTNAKEKDLKRQIEDIQSEMEEIDNNIERTRNDKEYTG